MKEPSKYPKEWLERVPAEVFACLIRGELRLNILPGVGLAGGGIPRDVPIEIVPFELRTPNSRIWVQFDESMNVVRVWRRE
jgi:hypothetical protein